MIQCTTNASRSTAIPSARGPERLKVDTSMDVLRECVKYLSTSLSRIVIEGLRSSIKINGALFPTHDRSLAGPSRVHALRGGGLKVP
jgi:hypothetical protein